MGFWQKLTDPTGSRALHRQVEEDAFNRKMQHGDDLQTAAGVATVDVICQQDLWDFIVEHTEKHSSSDFRPPAEGLIVQDEGMVTVPLSGRSLAAVLEAMYAIETDESAPAVHQALATRFFIAAHSVLAGVGARSDRLIPVLPIRIDDRSGGRGTGADAGDDSTDAPPATGV